MSRAALERWWPGLLLLAVLDLVAPANWAAAQPPPAATAAALSPRALARADGSGGSAGAVQAIPIEAGAGAAEARVGQGVTSPWSQPATRHSGGSGPVAGWGTDKSLARHAGLAALADNLPVPGDLLLIGALALACVAALAAAVAAYLALAAARRTAAGGDAARAAFAAGGKLFDSAAKRFIQAQDDARAAAEEAAGAASRAGQAAARLTGAARDVEARLRDCLDEAEARLVAAGGMARQFDQAAASLPDRLAQAVASMAAHGAPAIEDAAAALQASAREATSQFESGVRALPQLLADAIVAAAARGAPAIEDATAALQASAREAASRFEDGASALPHLLADAILAAAARGVPAIEAATARLTDAAEAMACVHGDLPGAMHALHTAALDIIQRSTDQAAALDGALTRAETVVARVPEATASLTEVGGALRDLSSSTAKTLEQGAQAIARCAAVADSAGRAAAEHMDDARAALRGTLHATLAHEWPAAMETLTKTVAGLREDSAAAAQQAQARQQAADGSLEKGLAIARVLPNAAAALAEAASRMDGLVEAAEASARDAECRRTAEADGAAILLQTLAARADAALASFPAEAAAMAAVSAGVRADAELLREAALESGRGQSSIDPALADRLGALCERGDQAVVSLVESAAILCQDAARLGAFGLETQAHRLETVGHGAAWLDGDTAERGMARLQATCDELARRMETLVAEFGPAMGPVGRTPASAEPVVEQMPLPILLRLADIAERTEQALSQASPAALPDGEIAAGAARLLNLVERIERAVESLKAPMPADAAADQPPLQPISHPAVDDTVLARLATVLSQTEAITARLDIAASAAVADAAPPPAWFEALAEAVSRRQNGLAGLEAALQQVETAAARVAATAEMQAHAQARVTAAAASVSANLAAEDGDAPAVSLSRLNRLAAEAMTLQSQADRLAGACLDGHTEAVPASVVKDTPALLSAIDCSIQRLRSTATALALATDAAQRAA